MMEDLISLLPKAGGKCLQIQNNRTGSFIQQILGKIVRRSFCLTYLKMEIKISSALQHTVMEFGGTKKSKMKMEMRFGNITYIQPFLSIACNGIGRYKRRWKSRSYHRQEIFCS